MGAYQFRDSAFYLLPGRAWELALGAFLALRGSQLPLRESWKPAGGWLGLMLMVVPVFLYDATTPFPGLAAVPPCAGAALVIWATNRPTGRLKQALSWRPVVFIGLISYSLYLWHWPVQVYSHYWLTGPSPLYARFVVLGIAVTVAYLSWRFVEQPFRRRRILADRSMLGIGALSATAAVVLVGLLFTEFDGIPARLPSEVVRYAEAYEDRPMAEEADVSLAQVEAGELPLLAPEASGRPQLLLWGDSHARVVAPALETLSAEQQVPGVRATRSSTPSLLQWGDEEMQRHNAAVLQWIGRHRPKIVILVSRWAATLHDEPGEEALFATVAAIASAGSEIWIMRQVPFLGQDVPRALARATLIGREPDQVGISLERHQNYAARSNAVLDRLGRAFPEVKLLDPIPYLTVDGVCVAEIEGDPLYYDNNHLTRSGARRLVPMFHLALAQRTDATVVGWPEPSARVTGFWTDEAAWQRSPHRRRQR